MCVAVAIGGVSLTVGHGQRNSAAGARADAPSVPGELLVQFSGIASEEDHARALGRVNGQSIRTLRAAAAQNDGHGDLALVRFPPDFSQAAAIRDLQGDPAVEFAEPNYIYTHQAVSNDPLYTNGSLWGMYGDATTPANPFGSQAGEAWAGGHIGSSAVYVGVIDEGIQYTHPDLAANIWLNPFDPEDGIDNDGNGYVDDVRGWDFNSDDNGTFDGGADDHGTHVAGTIGAVGGNGIGVAGVNWDVTLITAKFLGGPGGTTANAVLAVDYITDLKTRHGLNIVATNNSWGGGGYSIALHEALIRTANAQILFVAAAGNSGSNNDVIASYPSNYNTTVQPSYPGNYTGTKVQPASYDAVIAVMALARNGTIPSWTSFGATTVDLGAPGVGVFSTVPRNRYVSYSGTSMATPHVTGGAALYASTRANASARTIKNAILSSTVATASLSGKCVTGGRLNVSGF
jgi:subtilisin family serine protease